MSVQDTYNENMRVGVPGAVVNSAPKTLISRTVENADGVGFGLPVAQGSHDSGCHKATGNTAILGITVRDRSVDPATPNLFAQYASARILTKGVIYVTAAATVAAGDPVHVTSATFSNTGGVAIAGAQYETSGDSGDLVAVRLA